MWWAPSLRAAAATDRVLRVKKFVAFFRLVVKRPDASTITSTSPTCAAASRSRTSNPVERDSMTTDTSRLVSACRIAAPDKPPPTTATRIADTSDRPTLSRVDLRGDDRQ